MIWFDVLVAIAMVSYDQDSTKLQILGHKSIAHGYNHPHIARYRLHQDNHQPVVQ